MAFLATFFLVAAFFTVFFVRVGAASPGFTFAAVSIDFVDSVGRAKPTTSGVIKRPKPTEIRPITARKSEVTSSRSESRVQVSAPTVPTARYSALITSPKMRKTPAAPMIKPRRL